MVISTIKTTVTLREDVYEVLKKHGAKGMSKAINEILADALLSGESIFGTTKKVPFKDLRNHGDKT